MLFLVFPLSLQRSYGHFTGISVVSMTSVGLVLCLVVIGGPLYQAKYGTLTSSSTSALLLGTGGGSAPVSQLGSIIFTFSCASATFHTYKYMRVRTLAEWRVVARTTVFCGWCLCVAMGTAGFLVFGQSTEGIILANFQMGHVGDFFQLLFILHLILYIPLDFLVARHSLLRLCGVSSGALVDNKAHAALSFLLLALATLTILFLDASNVRAGQSFSIILNFTGGLGGSIISFVLPAWLFLSQLRASGPDRLTLANLLPSAKLLLSGLLFAIYVPVSTVISAVQGSS
jgi:amino acid permease